MLQHFTYSHQATYLPPTTYSSFCLLSLYYIWISSFNDLLRYCLVHTPWWKRIRNLPMVVYFHYGLQIFDKLHLPKLRSVMRVIWNNCFEKKDVVCTFYTSTIILVHLKASILNNMKSKIVRYDEYCIQTKTIVLYYSVGFFFKYPRGYLI